VTRNFDPAPAPVGPPFRTLRVTAHDLDLARQAIRDVHERAEPSEEALRAFLADDARYLFVALHEGRVAGSLNGYALRRPYREEPQFLLYEIDVRPEARRLGVGRALTEAFRAAAEAAGAYEIWVLTNASNRAAMGLYEACGMVRENRDDVMWTLPLRAQVGSKPPS